MANSGDDTELGAEKSRAEFSDEFLTRIPEEAAKAVLMLSQQAFDTHSRIQGIDRDLQRWHCSNGLSRRLATIPGIGPIGASALAASYQPS